VPGFFAYFVLAAYVPLSALAFFLMRPAKAAMFVVLVGILFLPGEVCFDAPLIPPLGKHEVATVCALVGMLAFAPRQWRRARLGRGGDAFLLLTIPAIVLTVFTNRDALTYGPLVLPGFTMHDLLALLVRFFFEDRGALSGRPAGRHLKSRCPHPRAHVRQAGSALLAFHAVRNADEPKPALLDLWLCPSPRLHADNPLGRLPSHRVPGTWLGSGPVRTGSSTPRRHRRTHHEAALGFARGLVDAVPGDDLGPLQEHRRHHHGRGHIARRGASSPRRQIRVAVLLAAICIAYPGAKLAGVFPEQAIAEFTRDHLSPERAASLQFRFGMDKQLMDHARERLLLGWGAFGRNRVYDETGRTRL
jgi:hypothetical protein